MLHPLIGLAMRGVIWYQGEDNYNRASTYADMFSALIRGWREEWQYRIIMLQRSADIQLS